MKPHFGYPMVCTKMWHIHFLSRRTLGLAPSLAAPCTIPVAADYVVTLQSVDCTHKHITPKGNLLQQQILLKASTEFQMKNFSQLLSLLQIELKSRKL